MEITTPQIQITITKAQLMELIQEALSSDAGPAIKRAITPLLANSFPQFPEFSNITIGETDESGTTTVILRQPRQSTPKSSTPLKSMEPLDVEITETELDSKEL